MSNLYITVAVSSNGYFRAMKWMQSFKSVYFSQSVILPGQNSVNNKGI